MGMGIGSDLYPLWRILSDKTSTTCKIGKKSVLIL